MINIVGGSFCLQIVLAHKLTSKMGVHGTHSDTSRLDSRRTQGCADVKADTVLIH